MPRSPRLLFPSGVPGLDDVLGGGIPEASLSLIGGGAGTGKTTLALQFAFANATAKAPALYFCGPAEPADRLAEYHEQLKFFDARRLDREVHLIDLGAHFSERDSGRVLDALAHDIAAYDPGVIVVDLPRSLTPPAMWSEILLFMAARLATTVVVTDGEPRDQEMCLADTVVSLEHAERGHTCVEVVKARGQSQLPGKHAMRLDWEGVRVFPRWATPWRGHIHRIGGDRLPTGVEGLDRLLSGGVRQPGSVLVDGASGTGKTMLATQFIAECGHQGRPGLVVLTEERPERFIARAHAMDLELERLVSCGLVELLSLRGRDVSGDELLHLIQRATLEIGAQAVVLDSVCGLDLLLDDVRDWLWRAVDSLSGAGVSVWLNGSAAPQLSSLVDDVLSLMRVDGVRRLELVKSSTFLTLRGSGPAVFEYEIGAHGIVGLSREEPRPTNGHLVSYRFAG